METQMIAPPRGPSKIVLYRLTTSIALLAIGMGGLLLFGGRKATPAEKPKETLVRSLLIASTRLENIPVTVSGYGTVCPDKIARVQSEISGRVSYVNPAVEDGAIVEKGEVLVRIVTDDYALALRKAEADLEELKSEKAMKEQDIIDLERLSRTLETSHRLEQKDFERKKKLFAKNALSEAERDTAEQELESSANASILVKREWDQARLSLASLAARIHRAETLKERAELDLRRSVIESPFTGRVESSRVEIGDYIGTNDKLMEIRDVKNLEIPVPLAAADVVRLTRFEPDDRGDYRAWFKDAENVQVTIEWAEAPDSCRWAGKITRVDRFDAETRTMKLTVQPTVRVGGGMPLLDGMFCRVHFSGRTLARAARIPWSAIQADGNVFVVDSANVLESRAVEVFSANNDELIVTGGLRQGDRLVTKKLPRGVVNGMKIKAIVEMDRGGSPEKH